MDPVILVLSDESDQIRIAQHRAMERLMEIESSQRVVIVEKAHKEVGDIAHLVRIMQRMEANLFPRWTAPKMQPEESWRRRGKRKARRPS